VRLRHVPALGRPVQVDPIKPMLKAPGTKRLKLKSDELLSKFTFKFNLRHYTLDESLFVDLLTGTSDFDTSCYECQAGSYSENMYGNSTECTVCAAGFASTTIGGAVQLDPIKPKLKPPGRLTLSNLS